MDNKTKQESIKSLKPISINQVHLIPTDHRLDIEPSPSPPSQQQSTNQQPQQTTIHQQQPTLVSSSSNLPYQSNHLITTLNLSHPNIVTPSNQSQFNHRYDQTPMHLRNHPPTKSLAPVTMVYRGPADESSDGLHHLTKSQLNPSVTALAPQTAINRARSNMIIDSNAPPSTIAPSYSLSHATEASLMKKRHHRLRELCRDRALLVPSKELTKREMVQALLAWREANISHTDTSAYSENDDLSMNSTSGYDTDDHSCQSTTGDSSFDDAIDPQLFSPDLNPAIYHLPPRHVLQSPTAQPDETLRGSSQPRTRMAIPTNFDLKATNSPHTRLANIFAATRLHNGNSVHPLDPSILKDPYQNNVTHPAPADVPSETMPVMSHPPMIPLLDDPTRNSKRRSIRLVGTKVPSIGPIGKMSMSSINVGGDGPMSIVAPKTMKGTQVPSTAVAPNGTIVLKSSSPPSPPASIETQDGTFSQASNGQSPHPSPPEDLDVLLDLEDLKLSDKEIPPEKLAREHKVGSGSFKDVYMGRYRNFRVAICDLRGRLTDMDIKELGLLRDLRHPNIVRFIGVSIGGTVPCTIVTELCRNGDLYDYIRKIPCPPYSQILAMMLDAARGVEYLHLRTPSIIHRDLKSPNVLITANGSAKITDFGLARVKRDVMSMCATTCGTLNWQAPELWVAHPSYNHSIDVYALGLVFWEVLCWPFKEKTYPFQGMNEHAIFAEVGRKKHRPSTSMLRRKWGREIVGLIEKMWDEDSATRPGMPDVTRLLNAMLLQEREKSWAANNSES